MNEPVSPKDEDETLKAVLVGGLRMRRDFARMSKPWMQHTQMKMGKRLHSRKECARNSQRLKGSPEGEIRREPKASLIEDPVGAYLEKKLMKRDLKLEQQKPSETRDA